MNAVIVMEKNHFPSDDVSGDVPQCISWHLIPKKVWLRIVSFEQEGGLSTQRDTSYRITLQTREGGILHAYATRLMRLRIPAYLERQRRQGGGIFNIYIKYFGKRENGGESRFPSSHYFELLMY